jgi:peroxiredoxin
MKKAFFIIPAVILFCLVLSIHANDHKVQIKTDSVIYETPSAAQDIRPLLIGSAIPALSLETVEGKVYDFNQEMKKQPSILIFYRGGWCPYCNTQLSELRKIEPKLLQLGYRILAISPDSPKKLAETLGKHKTTYTLLSDSKMKAAKTFGIAFQVDDKTLEKYKGYGIDLEDASGEKHHQLPVPSVFIIGKDGIMKFSYVNPDYKIRIDPDVLVAAAKAALPHSEPAKENK